ncbi:hypothetical protein EB796_001616 [Bugula neritina]|uniref:Transposase IS204/IS1001/IS1096/IS1165 DDE domain-containing protein n=1 Tax=Bugula neritina TaxID=10212 RepID=A0A7J7KPH0_BUGNE|nr:hypothetical protein EB796_001616 [Bugula neritina]
MLSSINIAVPTYRTFTTHQRKYLHGRSFAGREVDIAGDGRCDSPGHSALYGITTLMELKNHRVISSKLVKSTEVSSSNAMELEGLKRCREELALHQIKVSSLTTDRHTGVTKYVRQQWPEIKHYFDTWHISKGLKKRLAEKTRTAKYRAIAPWIKSICNHLYWCVWSSEEESDREEKWRLLLSHITNDHTKCNHETKPSTKAWIVQGSPCERILSEMLLSSRLINDIKRAGKQNTSELEAFHAKINHYAPKMTGYTYQGMSSRYQLAVMYHNENVNRPYRVSKAGEAMYSISRSKHSKLQPIATKLRVPPTYNILFTKFSLF